MTSNSDKLREVVDLQDDDIERIKAHGQRLVDAIRAWAPQYRTWFTDKIGWDDAMGDPLLPGILESHIISSYDDAFCARHYDQALHWYRKGMASEHALAAQSELRHFFIETAQSWDQPDLARSLCRVIDLTQAVQSRFYHLAHTLERLKRSAEVELSRVRRGCDAGAPDYEPDGLLRAYTEHYRWKLRAFALALGEQVKASDLPLSAKDCALGQWLAQGGVDDIPVEERDAFLSSHERLHQLGARILEEATAGRPFHITDYLLDMEAASEEIVCVLGHRIDCELRQLAAEDSLTRLGNRRLFERDLPRWVARSNRNAEGIALLFIDVDHFKTVNDKHGHVVGDEILRGVAGRIVEVLRVADTVYRWGGEEFAALISTDNVAELKVVAERLRASFVDTPHFTSAGLVDITVSIGAVFHQPDSGLEADELFSRVDRYMHAAKRAGRNRVHIET